MQKEDVLACPICGEKEFQPKLTPLDYTVTRETFTIVSCKTCSLLITTPRPTKESIGKYYQSQQYISHTGGSTGLMDRAYRTVREITLRRKLELVNQHQSKFNLLDYGCGTGQFLETCKDAGWTVTGIEPSSEARQKIRNDIEVHPSLDHVNTQVNAITLWHVLEHVHDLSETMAKLRALLSNNGTIFIAVPNHESYDARYYQEHWAAYDVPRHLWHFNKENIKRLLGKHNLKLKEILPMKYDAYYVSLLSESYRNGKPNSPFTSIKALSRGLLSNIRAGKDNYSSLIYVAGT